MEPVLGLISAHGVGGTRHSAARSSAVSVSRGEEAAIDDPWSSAAPIEPVWSGAFLLSDLLSVMIWYSLRAPSCARWPITVAAWPPTSQAVGWRLQNWPISETAAVAACTASDAPICGNLSDSGVFSLGYSTSTSPSQNVMRSRKNISRPRSSLLVLLRLRPQLCS